MDQQTYNRIIESGQPIEITAELMAAAQQNGLRQRSEAVAAGWAWLRKQLRSAGSKVPSSLVHDGHHRSLSEPCT